MYDHMNPSVILCSEELEDAINMRVLHVTEIRDRVMNQIEKIPREEIVLETRNPTKKESPRLKGVAQWLSCWLPQLGCRV